MDISDLRSDITKACDGFTTQDLESVMESYNSVLKDIVDVHAPEKSRVIVVRADAPWYTPEVVKEKRHKCNKTKLPVDKERLDHQRNIYITICLLKQNRTILKPKLKLQKLPKIFIKCVTLF